MRHYLKPIFFFFFAICSLYAEDDAGDDISQLDIELSGECEPLTIVAGCVNACSGHFFQVEKDLIGNTIDPLSIVRYYDSSNRNETILGYGFGLQFPLLASEMQDASQHSYALISERDGFFIPYRSKLHSDHVDNRKTCEIDPRLIEKGYTNLSRVEASGLTNFVNWRAIYRPKEKNETWKVQLGDKSQRIYGNKFVFSESNRKKLGLPRKTAFLLTEEIKPNGNRLLFNYITRHDKPYLSKVQTINRTGDTILNELNFKHETDFCEVRSSCSNVVSYAYKYNSKHKKILLQSSSNQKGTISYQSEDIPRELVVKVSKPRGQFVGVSYYNKLMDNKVMALWEPLGVDGKIINTYNFYYGKHQTNVINPLMLLKQFIFDDQHRTTRINYYSSTTRDPFTFEKNTFILMRQEHFAWSKIAGEEGWLKSKSVGMNDQIYHLKSFDYDSRGNIVRETIYGNLTGKCAQTFAKGHHHHADSYSVEYAYTKDGRNLLTEKKTPEGLRVQYDYLPSTNLRTRELQIYNGKVQERIFREFDDNGQPSLIVQDDGSGLDSTDLADVTVRQEKKIITYKEKNKPFFGKPKKMIDSALNLQTGALQTLKTTEFEYDEHGNEIKQIVRGSKEEVCYQIAKEYDDRQRLKSEVDGENRITKYDYDENNNKIYEELIGSGKIIRYTYDKANRLQTKTEQHNNGEIFTTKYAYNPLHQLTSEIDPYGHETNYEYDHLGRQIRCVKPAIQGPNEMAIRPVIVKEYNPVDQVIASTDENHFTTHYTYNAYGQPTCISYPDNTEERFYYYSCGWLQQKIFSDGTSVRFTYDPKGRVIKEATLDAAEHTVKEEEYGYKGSLLKYKKDALQLTTQYEYDGAGRKIREIVGDHLKETKYEYDDLGRLVKMIRLLDQQEGQAEVYSHDKLDRIISKSLQDLCGNTYAKELYEYDIHGNQSKTIIHQAHDKMASYCLDYESDGSLLMKQDPLGHQTRWIYNHHHSNKLNQRVQSRLILDPLDRSTRETDDAYHRLTEKNVFDRDQLMSSTYYDYDPAGNLIRQYALVMINGNMEREYIVEMEYDSLGRITSEKELPDGKITNYTYRKGRLYQKIKPDGVIIEHLYDALGRLKTIRSSDNHIHYGYDYDQHDNPTTIHDFNRQTIQYREYDLLNRLIVEEISSGVVIKYSYDKLDRLIQMTLPDQSCIKYLYDLVYLKKIQRFSPKGQLKYEYECQAHDMCGKLLKGRSPAGETHFEYDLLGRAIGIRTQNWESYQEQFDAVGNLLVLKQKDPSGEFRAKFTYDRFDHLNSEKGLGQDDYQYDSIGNCVQKNSQIRKINGLNQVETDGQSAYNYDLNGNLTSQTHPSVIYEYDALNRLTRCKRDEGQTHFTYDAFGRCLQITDSVGTKNLLYHGSKEVGAMVNGQLLEFCLVHPADNERVLAIELEEEIYFPTQDARYNICALKRVDGTLAEWYRYPAFGKEFLYRDGKEKVSNPWRFANRREVAGLVQFQHRLYHPSLMRWLTTDPAGFEEGMQLYSYVKNNPFYYNDPDGRFAFVIAFPLITWGAGVAFTAFESATLYYTLGTLASAAIGYGAYQLCDYYDIGFSQSQMDYESPIYHQEQTNTGHEQQTTIDSEHIEEIKQNGRKRGKDNAIKGGPPRDPKTGNYLPDPVAEGSAHTTIGTRNGSQGPYWQGATFDKGGKFRGRTDVTDHGRGDHPNPHYHTATGPNSANGSPKPITEEIIWNTK